MPVQRRRSLALVVGLAAFLAVAVAGQAAARFEPAPGTVVVRDDFSRSEVVRFLVPTGASIGRPEIEAAAAAAGVPDRGLEERASGRRDVRELRLDTSLTVRSSFLSRRIDAARLRRLDVFHQNRLVLELHPWATVVGGDVRPLGSDLLFRRYAVTGPADLAYRIPASAMLGPLVLVLLLTLVPYLGVRAYTGRVAASGAGTADKVHRLRTAMLAAALVLPLALTAVWVLSGLVLLPGLLVGGLATTGSGSAAAQVVVTMLLLALLFLVGLVPVLWAAGREYRKLRGITVTPASRRGSARLALAFGLPLLLWLPLVAVPLTGGLPAAVRLGLQAAWVVLVLVTVPLLAVRVMPTRPLEHAVRARLEALVERAGVRIREIRVLDTRSQQVANAVVMGPVPRLRYVLVTDHLLESLDQDELEAVVAHELGHAKQHHVLVKLGALLLLAVAVGVGVALGSPLLRSVNPTVLVLVLPVLLVLALLLVQGGLGLVLERRADEYAAGLVGVDPTVRGLERVAEANLLKRRTGLLWNLLTHHPGVAQRVERLRARQPHQRPTPPAPTATA